MPKITVETENCIGCGACQAACEEFFSLEGEKISLKDAKESEGKQELEVEDLKCARDAAEVCPTQCINVEE